jgi:hypothetical protein
MGEPRAARRRIPWRKPFGVLLAVAMGLFLVANADQPEYLLALRAMGLVLIGVIGLFVWRAIWRRRSRRAARPRGSDLVMICAKPMMKVPTLDGIFAALPEYCARLP